MAYLTRNAPKSLKSTQRRPKRDKQNFQSFFPRVSVAVVKLRKCWHLLVTNWATSVNSPQNDRLLGTQDARGLNYDPLGTSHKFVYSDGSYEMATKANPVGSIQWAVIPGSQRQGPGSSSGGGRGSTGGNGPGPWGGSGSGGGGGWHCWSNGSGVTCRPIQHH